MKRYLIQFITVLLPLIPVPVVNAEPVYITDEFSVGLHEDKTLDSPIVMVLRSGAQLELVKREDNLSFVQDTASGTSGWIDNSYINIDEPASARLNALTARNNALERQLNNLKGSGNSPDNSDAFAKLTDEHETLQQQFNSERLRVGELQKTNAELRKRLGHDNDTESLYREIETLRELNKGLEIQLASVQDGNEALSTPQGDASFTVSDGTISFSIRNILIFAVVLMVIGLSAGIYFMDFLNRRRHGGFRI